MGVLVAALARLNRALPRESLERRASDDAYTQWEHETGRRIFLEHFGSEPLRDARVLDAACGPGGKTAWYGEAGARGVLGVDLDGRHLRQARRFAAARGVAGQVHFARANAVRLPARDGDFDVATANDAMEHFDDPAGALAELARVLRPGGRLYVTFPPYYSAWGAHLYDHVAIPWCQVVLPRRILYALVERAATEREAAAGGGADHGRERAREAIAFFETQLNRMTVGRFVRLVRAESRLRLVRLTCVPSKLFGLSLLTGVPGLRELATGLAVAELERV